MKLVENERLRGWATITFNDSFVVKVIRIIQGKTRLFVAMPSKQQKDGKYQDIAHPITMDCRDYVEQCVLDVYNQVYDRETDQGYRPAPAASGDLEGVEELEDAQDF